MDTIHIRFAKVTGRFSGQFELRPAILSALFAILLSAITALAQTADGPPRVVQPGAPGQPTRVLPATTRAMLPPRSAKNVEFMQGMIMHHAQAVEMTALIAARTQNKGVRGLGARISHTQEDEIRLMKRWLEARGEPVEMAMPGMSASHSGHSMSHQMMMPGMLTQQQMSDLRDAKGAEFDKLFLEGMIQHHNGALIMVKDLFDTAGAGQDAELFNFASDVDSGQRAEINIMRNMLGEKPVREKI